MDCLLPRFYRDVDTVWRVSRKTMCHPDKTKFALLLEWVAQYDIVTRHDVIKILMSESNSRIIKLSAKIKIEKIGQNVHV